MPDTLNDVITELTDAATRARASWEEAVSHSLGTIADTSHKSDQMILDVVKSLVTEVLELRGRVEYLEARARK
jgi:hypothetical protein